jgi:formylglycine-generating enzyme required for sulfatase activity
MVYVPAGEFPMGSGDAEIAVAKADCPGCPEDWFDGERPLHTVSLDAYWIDQYEVTNQQYAKFVEAGGYAKRELWTEEGWAWSMAENRTQPKYWGDSDWNKADYPVVGVVWFEALAYCRWAGARLPTEAEWERAAGWDADRQKKSIYPWGDDWDPARANTVESALGSTTPAGHYCPEAASPVGACDLVGNAWEWVSSIYMSYPYRSDDGREDLEAHGTRALRGGSWLNERDRARVTYRLPPFPGDFILFDPTNGFRCAMPDQ